jgi:hypothetical protein
MNEVEEYPPVRVHVVSTEVAAAPKRRKQKRTVCNTAVLTSTEPVQEILPKSDKRVVAFVQALDNDVVIVTSISQGQAKSNTATNVPYPSGTYLPKANTAPLRIDGNDLVYAGITTTASNSRVSIIATYYEE